MGAACCIQKQKNELGVQAEPHAIKGKQLTTKLSNANKLKMLSFDNTKVATLESKYAIEKLRVMHFVNCSMVNISGSDSLKVFQAAGESLKKVNLAHNKIAVLPKEFFEHCPRIESLILGQNQITSIPQTLSLLTKLTELDLSSNRLSDGFGLSNI